MGTPVSYKKIQKTTDVGLDNWPIIAVRFDSSCIHCGKIIIKGKKAQWFKGVGIRHEKCAEMYKKSKHHEKNAVMGLLIGDHSKAAEFAKNALDEQPYNESTFFRLAGFFFDVNEYAKAIQMYNKILENNPTSHNALYSKAAAFGNLGQHVKSLRYYRLALKAKPNDVQTLDQIQFYYFMKKKYLKSIQILKKICKLEPKNEEYLQKLEGMYFGTGDFENALRINRKRAGITKHPIYAMIEREDYFNRMIDEENSEIGVLRTINKHLKHEDKSFIDFIMYKFYHRFDKDDQSEIIYKKIIESKPVTEYDIVRKGNFYFATKDYTKTIEFCKEHLHIKNLKRHLLHTMGLAYSKKEKYLDAAHTFFEILKTDVEEEVETPNRIVNLIAKNFEAANVFNMALKVSQTALDKSHGQDQQALERIIRILKKTKQESKIFPYIRNLHDIDPFNNTVSLEYVGMLMQHKNYPSALNVISELEKRLEADSEDVVIVSIKKATCLFHIGDVDTADEIFKDLVKKDKKLKDALEGLAMTSISKGKTRDAQKALKECDKIISEFGKETQKEDLSNFDKYVNIHAAGRALEKGKNIITKPTFRYNPDKKIPDNSIVKTALNSIVALFNSHGGILRIGITDKKPTGIKSDLKVFAKNKRTPEELEKYIKKTVKQRLSEPEIEKFISFTFPKIKSKVICEMVIPHSNVPIFVKSQNKDEEFYVLESGKATRLGPKQQIKYIKENFEGLN